MSLSPKCHSLQSVTLQIVTPSKVLLPPKCYSLQSVTPSKVERAPLQSVTPSKVLPSKLLLPPKCYSLQSVTPSKVERAPKHSKRGSITKVFQNDTHLNILFCKKKSSSGLESSLYHFKRIWSLFFYFWKRVSWDPSVHYSLSSPPPIWFIFYLDSRVFFDLHSLNEDRFFQYYSFKVKPEF